MKAPIVATLLSALLIASSLIGQESPEPDGVALPESDWKNAALLYFNSASFEVNRIRAEGDPDRRMKYYADALDAIHRPGSTPDELEKAKDILSTIAAYETKDDLTLASKFYLIRIIHKHQAKPDAKLAGRLYKDLYLAAPGHFFGQMALQMHAFIALYHDVKEDEVEGVFAELEVLGADMSIPDPKRGFHRVMGEAYQYYGLSDRKSFEHLKVAFELGFPLSRTQVGPLLQLGELAEKLGEKGYAIQIYSDFLGSQRSNPRRSEVEVRLRGLGAAVE
ncbi:MAG: hypothetical protein AAGB46_04730 [Verrucomicrobiota bacterium]